MMAYRVILQMQETATNLSEIHKVAVQLVELLHKMMTQLRGALIEMESIPEVAGR